MRSRMGANELGYLVLAGCINHKFTLPNEKYQIPISEQLASLVCEVAVVASLTTLPVVPALP